EDVFGVQRAGEFGSRSRRESAGGKRIMQKRIVLGAVLAHDVEPSLRRWGPRPQADAPVSEARPLQPRKVFGLGELIPRQRLVDLAVCLSHEVVVAIPVV